MRLNQSELTWKSKVLGTLKIASFGISLSVVLALPAAADIITINSITPAFQNAVGGGGTVSINNGGDPIMIRWGTPTTAGQSGYDFNDTNTPFNVDTTVNEGRFVLGTFTHINAPITGPALTQVDLSLNIGIASATPSLFSEVFTLFHNETLNQGGPCPGLTCSDDIVTFSGGSMGSFFTVGGNPYFIQLFGFSVDGGTTILPQFSSPEGGTNNALLYGQIVAGTPIPEPSSLLLFGGTGLLVLLLRKRIS
jgi:hypothetical protein